MTMCTEALLWHGSLPSSGCRDGLPMVPCPGGPWPHTHHALVGLLTRVYPHMDEQLIAGIEGLVAAHAASPEAGEVLAFALVNVALLNVPY